MEVLVASMIGILTAAGVYLILRLRTFPVIVGTTMLSYAVNLFLFASGRLALDLPPILNAAQEGYADPLPQALVLTAIVISFGMTAVVVLVALGAYLEGGTDRIDMDGAPEDGDETPPDDVPPPDLEPPAETARDAEPETAR
ncbi:MAG: Na+/H+ antiporter subunit C [Pseudomonadota bacterium]